MCVGSWQILPFCIRDLSTRRLGHTRGIPKKDYCACSKHLVASWSWVSEWSSLFRASHSLFNTVCLTGNASGEPVLSSSCGKIQLILWDSVQMKDTLNFLLACQPTSKPSGSSYLIQVQFTKIVSLGLALSQSMRTFSVQNWMPFLFAPKMPGTKQTLNKYLLNK